MNYRNSERFLNAFSKIEDILRDMIGANHYVSFYQLVDKARHLNKSVQAFAVELKEYGDLRNAIVHERIDGQVIAEPHPQTVERLETICAFLDQPPKVKDGFLGEVFLCSPSDLLGPALAHFLNHSFSQMPVYRDGQFIGMLTAETVARWVAARLAENGGPVTDEPIEKVMKYAEAKETCAFVDVEANLFDVLSFFEDFHRRGKHLDAVLITPSGRPSEIPIGIITVFDLPMLYEAVGIQSIS